MIFPVLLDDEAFRIGDLGFVREGDSTAGVFFIVSNFPSKSRRLFAYFRFVEEGGQLLCCNVWPFVFAVIASVDGGGFRGVFWTTVCFEAVIICFTFALA